MMCWPGERDLGLGRLGRTHIAKRQTQRITENGYVRPNQLHICWLILMMMMMKIMMLMMTLGIGMM